MPISKAKMKTRKYQREKSTNGLKVRLPLGEVAIGGDSDLALLTNNSN